MSEAGVQGQGVRVKCRTDTSKGLHDLEAQTWVLGTESLPAQFSEKH